jgi:hypothetical protein
MKLRVRDVRLNVAVAAVVALGLLGLMSATASTARAAVKPPPADYVVASFSVETNFGTSALFTSVDGSLCLPPSLPPESCLFGVPLLLFPSLTKSGETVWTDAASANFEAIVEELTNGEPGLLSWALIAPGGVAGVSIVGQSELALFDDQVGPSGVDLAGYTIDRIGLRVDSISFTPTGSGTSFAFSGAFLFEGKIASKEVCMNGGWQSLQGPGGAVFHNQGECIQLVNTGK